MKDSGVEWIGEIPDGWEVNRIGNLFEERVEKVSDKEFLPLSVTRNGIVEQLDKIAKSDASDDRKKVLAGDFVINSRSDRKQSCGISNLNGSVSLINIVIYPKCKNNICGNYTNYLLKNYGFAEEYYRWGHGIVDDLWTTNWQDMKNILVPLPPLETQNRIAAFLEKKCAQIDSLVDITTKEIEKLKEYKQALITKAVTKGLDENMPMKDSGVEWIGEVPKGWEVKKAKYFSAGLYKGNGITKDEVLEEGNVPCVRYGEIYAKYDISFSECFSKTNLEFVPSQTFVEYGDILFAGTGELIEEIGKNIVYLGKDRCLAGGDIIVMKHNQDPRFLNYSLYCSSSQMQKSCGKSKLKVIHISASEIGNVYIAMPSLDEQKEIAAYLDEKCAEIDKLISLKKKKIELLGEYKKSLIYEYVTGKKEV